MTNRTGLSRTALAAAIVLCGWTGARGQPALDVVRTSAHVAIDGRLDEAVWAEAGAGAGFTLLGGKGEAKYATRVRAAADRAWLYLAFECAHPSVNHVRQTVFRHDAGAHKDESVEIFLDPGAAGELYYHYKISLFGVTSEKRMTRKDGPEVGWDTPWRSCVLRAAAGWSAEMAVPLVALAAYGDVRRARMNVARNAVVPELDEHAAVRREVREMSSWSPVARSFHETDRFRDLRGLGQELVEEPFLPALESVRVDKYYATKGAYHYNVLLQVAARTGKAGRALLTVLDEPGSGEARELRQTVDLAGNARREITVPVPVADLAQRSVTVTLADADGGDVFASTVVEDVSGLNLMTAWLGRSYYTNERAAYAVCDIGLPASELDQTALLAVVKDAVLGRTDQVKPSTRLRLDIAGLPPGEHGLEIRVARKSGELLFTESLELVKRPPKPGFEVKIDRTNHRVLRDGKPFFPFGIVMAGGGRDPNADYARIAAAGFNTVVYWSLWRQPESAHDYFKLVQRHGLFVVGRTEAYFTATDMTDRLRAYFAGAALERAAQRVKRLSPIHLKGAMVTQPEFRSLSLRARTELYSAYAERNVERVRAYMRVARQYPCVIAHNLFDEAGPLQYPAGKQLYRTVHEEDGYRPAFLLYSSWIPKHPDATSWCDVLSTDPYWIPAGHPRRGTPNYVTRITRLTRQRGDRDLKAVWIVPQAEFWSGCHKRVLLPEEQYCQTYLALIHGAKGILYFRYPINHRLSWQALCGMAEQAKVLGPIAVSDHVRQQVVYQPGELRPEEGKYPDVQVRLRRNPSGGTVLLAANSRPYPVRVTYRLSFLPGKGEVGRLFSEVKLRLQDRAFSELLSGCATRAYAFEREAPGREGDPVRIEVEATPDQSGWQPETGVPVSGRPGKRNIAPNPGFEQATLPGWPDYFRPYGWEPVAGEPFIGDPETLWGRCTEDAFEGEACLKIVIGERRKRNGLVFSLAPQPPVDTAYTFSAYLKASRDGMRAQLVGSASGEIRLPTTWQRCSVRCVIPARQRRGSFGMLISDPGVVLVDAVQVEAGEEPTPFEP